ncbi:MAG: DNA polymerase III subunit beta [Anaerovoracaceae bacterium]
MKFTCSQQILSKALNTVSKAVTVRTTIPILKGILIKANNDGTVTFSASDLDLSIEKKAHCNVIEPGEVVVFAKLFGDIIRKLPNEEISIELVNGNLSIKSLNSEFNIVGQSADEFPNIAEIKEISGTLSFDKDIFREMIKKTYFSASIDESKGVIVGVLMEIEENNFNMVALDGFRMAVSMEQMKNEKPGNIIISGKTLGEINKILSETDSNEDIKITIGDKKVILIIDNTKIVVRVIEGDFIKYRDILPKDAKTKMIVNRSELVTAIERASLLAKEGKNNLVKCTIEGNLLNVTSRSEEGTVKEDIIVEKTGEDLEIGFNSKYLLEALKAVDDESVLLELNTSITPCLIKPVTGNQFIYLILPVRITSS